MSYRVLARNLPTGGLEITYPSPQLLEQHRGFASALEALRIALDMPDAKEATWGEYQRLAYWHDADPTVNALHFEKKNFVVDMAQARLLHMRNIRAVRDQKLAELDARELEARSKGDGFLEEQIRAEKQALRDLPARLDLEALTDPGSLQSLWPEELR